MKRRMACITALVMTAGMVCTAPLAQEIADYAVTAEAATVISSGTCGPNLTWTVDSNRVLTISGTGEMYDYDGRLNNAPGYSNSCDKVIIQEGVTSIGDYAFNFCRNLTSITIPNSVTSIGDHAFYYCQNLTSITIPNSVTNIKDHAFDFCESLTSITIPNSVTSIGGRAFYGCSSLTSITIPDSVTSIGDGAFSGCSGLTSITIPDSVTSIGYYTFDYCYNLTSITIPDSVTSIGDWAFDYCYNLTSITIPDSVTSIGDRAFFGCISLSKIEVDAGNTAYAAVDSVLYNKDKTRLIQYPLGNKNTEYTVPASVTSIGQYVFDGYENSSKYLSSITISNPKCMVYNDTSTLPENLVIYGYEDSPAQRYAENYLRTFVALDASDTPPSSGTQEPPADLNGDGQINALDAALILQYAAYVGAGGKEDILTYIRSL